MRKLVIGVAVAASVASPTVASTGHAGKLNGVKLKYSGRIVISNDATAIRATRVGSERTPLVQIRSTPLTSAAVAERTPAAPATATKRAPATRKGAPALPAAGSKRATPAAGNSRPRRTNDVPPALAGIFREAAERYSLDPLLLAAVARQESRFRPDAVSPVGARGVMQLMPRTAAELGVRNSFDARQNIFGGARYLRRMLDQFGGRIDLSLAAYNAGPGAVRKHRGIPPYRETTAYVAAIRRDYDSRRGR